jgi:ABC-2 type transport system ATP-binding protein
MSQLAIRTDNLTRRFDMTTAVDHVSFEVPSGEISGFLGHNGAGKTTTIRLLTTLLLPTSGTATVFGADIGKDNFQVRRNIGYVPENVRMYNELSVEENLKFLAALSGVQDISESIASVLAMIGHPEWRKARVGTLSKGMRQRIGIAQALLHEPKLLFLDEPASGPDPDGTRAIGELIIRLNAELGITVFMNTHQLGQVAKLCSSIGIMNHGRLILTDRLESVLEAFPHHFSLEDVYLDIEKRVGLPA